MKARSAKPSARYTALLQLLRTADTVWNASHAFFARWNLSPSQFNVLNLLSGCADGCSQIELGRRLLTHRSNVTGLVDRMEARGLVRRLDDARDRRAFRVVLTPAGRKLLDEIHPQYVAAAEAVWNGVPARKAADLASALEAVAENAGRMESESDRKT